MQAILISLVAFAAVFVLIARFGRWLEGRPLTTGPRADLYIALFGVALYATGLTLRWAWPSLALGWWTFGNDALALAVGVAGIRVAVRAQADARAAALAAQAYQPGGVAVNFDPPPPQLDTATLLRFDPDVILRLYVERADRDVAALEALPIPGPDYRCALESLSACAEALAVLVDARSPEGVEARVTAVAAAARAGGANRAHLLLRQYDLDPAVDVVTRERMAEAVQNALAAADA